MPGNLPLKTIVRDLMKCSFLQLCIIVAFSGITFSHNRLIGQGLLESKITLKMEDKSLKSVLLSIERNSEARFIYNPAEIRSSTKVTFQASDEPLAGALARLLKPLSIRYEVAGNQVMLFRNEASSSITGESPPDADRPDDNHSMLAPVKGKVTDEKGDGLPGVSVVVKGTSRGTTTNSAGQYELELGQGENTLIFSFVGYLSQEIPVGARSELNVALKIDTKALDEVVVVGYGEMKRADLTTAQTSVSAKDIARTTNTTLEQAIQGRAAGVYITQNSGQPGGGISVNIRGINSISGSNEPLYVVDGVQIQGQSVSFGAQSSSNPLAGLNPADIESVEVLQGPSATAIYGSRATNGVLLITTKRGKSGDSKIAYGYQFSLQTPPKPLKVMDLGQYAQMVGEYHKLAGGETPEEFLDPSLLGKGTDWQKELFKNAPMHKHQLSLSGGNDRTTYYLSGEYLRQDGVALGSGFNRYAFRLNLDNKPREWASIGANLSFNQTNDNLTTSQENVISNALQLTPQVPVRNIDGSWGGGDENNGANIFAPVNPIAIANLTTNKLVRRQLLGGLNIGVRIAKGLQFRTSFNTNLGFSNSSYYIPTYKIGWAQNVTASYTNGSGVNTYWNWNQLLEYNKQFGKHNINVMLSHESQESGWKNLGGGRTGFLTNDILDLAAGDALTASNSGGSGEWAMESYLGRLNYNFADRYIIMGTIRRDGSANFGADNKWGVFPSVSAAWRVSQEPFFDVPAISELKLRFETGVTGNQGSGGIYSPMGTGTTPTTTGFLPTKYANDGLKWEETKTNNFGINLALFQNRIQFEFDYYIKNTDNLLMEKPLPWYMGTNGVGAVGSPTVNIGALQNKGWGFTINTVNVNRGGFKWESNLNISSFKTKIKSFYSDAAFVDRTSWWLADWTQRSEVGKAPWLFRGYIEEGLFQSVEEIEASALPVDNNGVKLPINENNIWVGDVKFKDVNGDGIINEKDQTVIGNPWPKMFAGFTNTFSYKGFDLSILLTSTYGNDVYNFLGKLNTNASNINLSRNLLVHAMDYAKPVKKDDGTTGLANPGTDVARISNGPNGNFARHTDKWVEDGSFIRLKNISLTYNLPVSLVSRQKIIRGARVSVGAQNVATITGYSGFDPEVGAYVSRDASAANQAVGLDYGRYPLTPVYTFSLGLDF
ncbi:TonB-linked outer membrane protein, SusC/RagA family [Dyadobacter soli]|uniref:TonB-linked outer membrane protein, SusC/RagA family n=1 Tax=Dyadobacter soli TaxID=659014 RepID=A0A1G6ZMN3_9BACT|nr:TonB-dependent receptor [Dyadobacter soli]SDE03752.1 TonB-linked outer membrane protein, SusC/RagA family [Dyadobacter soli]